MVRSCLSDSRLDRFLLRSRTLWTTWQDLEFSSPLWRDRLVEDRFMVLRSLSGKCLNAGHEVA